MLLEYVEALGHGGEPSSPLFRPVRNNLTGRTNQSMTTDGVYQVVRYYTRKIGIGDIKGLGVHSLRATAGRLPYFQGGLLVWVAHGHPFDFRGVIPLEAFSLGVIASEHGQAALG